MAATKVYDRCIICGRRLQINTKVIICRGGKLTDRNSSYSGSTIRPGQLRVLWTGGFRANGMHPECWESILGGHNAEMAS